MRTLDNKAKRKSRRQTGVAAVELALLIVPLLIMSAGVLEIGRALYQYNSLTKSVRNASRFLSIQSPADADYPADTAKCLAVFGNSGCTGEPVAPGLTTAMIEICNPVDASACAGNSYSSVETGFGTINLVEVRIVGYPFKPFLPGLSSVAPVVFDNIGSTMRQVL